MDNKDTQAGQVDNLTHPLIMGAASLDNSEYYSTMQPTNPEPDPARD
jgi:hypothetical protein